MSMKNSNDTSWDRTIKEDSLKLIEIVGSRE